MYILYIVKFVLVKETMICIQLFFVLIRTFIEDVSVIKILIF